MKKKNHYLFFLPLFLLVGFFGTQKVEAKAVTVEGTDTAGGVINTKKCTKLSVAWGNAGVQLNEGVYNFSQFQLGNSNGLCIDQGLSACSQTQYYLASVSTDSSYSKALNHMDEDDSKEGYAAAQVYAWGDTETCKDATCDKFKVFSEYLSTGDGYKDYQNFRNFEYSVEQEKSDSTVYIWRPLNGNCQQIITTEIPPLEDCVFESKCKTTDGGYYISDQPVSKAEYEKYCTPKKTNTCPPPTGTAGQCASQSHFEDLGLRDYHAQFEVLKSCSGGDKEKVYANTGQNALAAKYCKAYCVEAVESAFPTTIPTVRAGQYYTVGGSGGVNNWGPIRFKGTRVCKSFIDNGKTEGVNTELFIREYNALVRATIEAYNNWKNEQRKLIAVNRSIARKEWTVCRTTRAAVECPRGGTADGLDCKDAFGRYYTPSYSCGSDAKNTGDGYCEEWGWEYSEESYATYNGYYASYGRSSVGGSCSEPSAHPSSAAYESNLSKLRQMTEALISCGLFKFGYDFEPEVMFSSQFDPSYKVTPTKLSAHPHTENILENGPAKGGVGGDPSYCSGATCLLTYYTCGACDPGDVNSGCRCAPTYNSTAVKNDVYDVNVTMKTRIIDKTVYYSLDKTNFKYISKSDGGVTGTLSSVDATNFSYMNFVEGAIPVSTSLTPKRYANGVQITFSNVGHQGHFDKYVGNEVGKPVQCPIRIINEIEGRECQKNPENCERTCSTWGKNNNLCASGIDVVYRTIKLGTYDIAFPSIDADSRDPGSNWYTPNYKEQNNNSLVYKYITNNRNVSGEEVYNLTPLYKITLTPARIKEIRNYNKALVDDKISYGDFNLSCDSKEQGRYCISNFIHHTVSAKGRSYNFSTYFKENAGTCQNALTKSTFNSCADKG